MPVMLSIDPASPDEAVLHEAAAIMKEGGVIAYPTETFYGLGADITNRNAIEKLFTLKGRDFSKPIPLIIGREEDLTGFAEDIPETGRGLMKRFWPGPLTLIFRASAGIDARLTGGTGKIGIRFSGHPVAAGLALHLAGAVTATSANRSGHRECISAEEVAADLGNSIDAVIDGGSTPGGLGSTILDVTIEPPLLIRQGVILVDDLIEITELSH